MDVSDELFQQLIDDAFDSLPKEHRDNVRNVAILYEDYPTEEQRQRLNLQPNQTLFGLYEGTPLSQRQGMTHLIPDRITLFKGPILMVSHDMRALKEQIRHTLWHEVAHYYGLDHDDIHKLET